MLGLVEVKKEGYSSVKRQGQERREECAGRGSAKKIKAIGSLLFVHLGWNPDAGLSCHSPIF